MNPLNGQQQPTPTASQYYITGLPPLTPATGTSILKSNVAATAATVSHTPQTAANIVTTTGLNSVGSVGKGATTTTTGNSLMDNTKYVTTATNYMPVLLTNQTLISTVDPIQQQTTKITPAGTAPMVVHTPVLTGNSSTTLTSVNANKPLVLTSANNAGNITYQVLSTSQNNNNNNNLTPVISAPNGSVSVILASSQTMATAGHVAAPIIIRNTPTTATTTKTVQIKQEQQLSTKQQQQQQHQPQQQQQKTKMNTFNPQTFNADILKQIVVGNPGAGATANLAPGTTLLKPTILQNKPIIQQQYKQQPTHQQQIQNKTLIKNTPKMLVTTTQHYPQQHQLQQKLNNHTVITTTTDNSSQMFAALGMELVKANTVAQTVQKLPQVSLLQNSNKKATNIITELNHEPTAKTILKNPHEIKVGNLNSEVSLIKKPNLAMHEMKTKEMSLLKSSNSKLPAEIVIDKRKTQDSEKSTKIQTKTNSQNAPDIKAKKETNESYSLLKTSLDFKKSPESHNNATKTANILVEKQKSLLKPKTINKKSPPMPPQQTSPRSQRSNSCNTVLKPKSSLATAANSERRHSEPAKIELVITSNNTEAITQDNQDIELLKSDEMDIYFEDEEYLESSGDKLSIASEKSQDKDKQSPQNNKELQEKHETTPPAKDSSSNKATATNTPTNNATENDKEKKTEQQNQQTQASSNSSKDNQEGYATNSSEDDDVTILPMDEMEIEPIEIDDDEEDNESLLRSSSENKERLNESLLCDEQFIISSSSSVSNNSVDQNSATTSLIKSPSQMDNPTTTTTTTSPLLKKTLMEPKAFAAKDETQQQPNGYSSVLDMLSNFNMLNWRERIGTARGTNLKFQLNEFNLIQLYEKSMPNKRIHTAYEKPIYERESSHRRNENGDPPTYYTCRRCNVQGPSVDFLAPEFCSLSCLKRDCRKRRDDSISLMRKRNRLSNLNMVNKNYNININNSSIANITTDALNINNPPPLTYIKKPKFRWSTYMNSNFTTMAAPISLFLNPFPTGPNNFTIGMKLEAIDPENCALFCVCTIIDIMGYRLKLSFDGYDNAYDFWLNADSMDIFPPGWCAKTNRILQPPKGITANKFNWGAYLNKEKAVPAPRYLFTHLNSSSLVPRNPFKVGMHLEAEDLNDTGKLCVASVADVLDDRIRIHFDGWDDCYDIIVDINSPYIHPCGWHEGRQQLVVPPDCENSAFNWNDYIRKQGTGEAASEELFNPREPIGFKPNMRLEVVDPRNPSLIRPATVVTHKGHRVKLHLDGWPSDYCFWLEDDSPDLHPIGWCDATGHDLEPPPGFQMTKQKMPCPVEGCRGIGNAKKAFMGVHATRDGCPYAAENWRIVVEKPQRINYDNIVRTLPKQNKQLPLQQPLSSSLPTRLSEQQILERLQMLDNIKTRNILVQQEKLPTNSSDLLGGFSLPQLKKEETKASKNSNNTSISPAQAQNSNDNVLDVNLDIAKEFLFDYGPRLQQNFTLWQKNFTFDAEKIKRNPLNWSTTEVSVFVELYLKCRKTATIFCHEDIDGESFLLLQQEDLTEKLGLKLGPAVKLYTCILQLRTLAVTKFEVPYKRAAIKK